MLARKGEGVAKVCGVLDGSLTTLLEENVVPSLEDLVKSVPKPEKLMEFPQQFLEKITMIILYLIDVSKTVRNFAFYRIEFDLFALYSLHY